MEEAVLQSQQLLEKTFASMDQTVFVVDAKTQAILASNPAVERIFGYTEKEVLGRNTGFLHVDQESYEAFQREMAAALLANGVYHAEFQMRRKDGSTLFTDQTVTQVLDDTGNMTSIVYVVRDITQKKQMEEELIKAKKLEASGVLAGGIAHDFNNLLAVILGNINMAQEYLETGSPAFKLLEDAEKAALRASHLTRQFITFATGGSPLKRVTSIEKLIQDAVSLACSGSNVECQCEFPPDLWKVEIDESQMNQVIYNMILNAREAMPQGGMIRIVAENFDASFAKGLPLKAGLYVKISISDQGVGIPEKDKDKIFDPYFSTKDKGVQKGMGLGLSIAHSIIKKHEGYIMLDSRLGVGTTFHIYLPTLDKPATAEKKPGETGHPLKILLMDDEKLMRNMVSQMLHRLGYQVAVASDGAEAIQIFKDAKERGEPFDMVILDLTVKGGMGGLQALKELQQYDPQTRAIVSSGYSQDPVIASFKQYGFCGAITKPYSLQKLREVLDSFLCPQDH